jgi:CRP-like cAMP-binding protein
MTDNDLNKIKTAFNTLSVIPENEWNEFANILQLTNVESGNIIFKKGNVTDSVVFILNGLFRYYIERDIEEHTIQFFSYGEFMTDFQSYSINEPTQFTFQALEESRIFIIKRETIDDFCIKYSSFMLFAKKIAEKTMVEVRNERLKLLYSSAEENYQELMDKRPYLINKVQQKMLASYLGITPQHLSRIRKAYLK